tara:strand:- start:327 stop:497 length:171 start_codon:yes stop_codon:yes gene_type:complete
MKLKSTEKLTSRDGKTLFLAKTEGGAELTLDAKELDHLKKTGRLPWADNLGEFRTW